MGDNSVKSIILSKGKFYEMIELPVGYFINFNVGEKPSIYVLRLAKLGGLRRVRDLESELRRFYPAIWGEMCSRGISSWEIYLSLKEAYKKSNVPFQMDLAEAPGWR